MVTERLVGKSIRDFYAGKVGIKDVGIALQIADNYNGVTALLATDIPEKLPSLLTIEVQNVDVEMPPDRQIELVEC